MKGSKIRLSLVFILAIFMVIGLCGCGKSKNVSSNAMGRYIEEEVSVPDNVQSGNEQLTKMMQGTDNEIILFTYETKADVMKYHQYILQEDKWSEQDIQWAENETIQSQGIQQVKYGQDGKLYIAVNGIEDNKVVNQFFRVSGDKLERIELGEGKATSSDDDSSSTQLSIDDFVVLPDGKIAIQKLYCGDYNVYDSKGGEPLYSFKASAYGGIAANSKYIILLNDEREAITLIDAESGVEKCQIPLALDNNVTNYNYALYADEETAYMVTNSGLYSIGLNGTITTTLVQGASGNMSTPNIVKMNMYRAGETIYILYETENGNSLMKYNYHDNISSTPDKVFTVYSLEQNYMVQQACLKFQRQNPDIGIDYRIVKNVNSSLTMEDYIKSLNTEILVDDGADVIICDNLPAKDYMEKGVFMDISDIVLDNKDLYQNVLNDYEKDGKVYVVPMRFAPCIYVGESSIVNKLDSMEALMKAAESEDMLGTQLNVKQLFDIFYMQYYTELQDKDGLLIKDKFVEFLENLKKINHFDKDNETDNWEQSAVYMSILQGRSKLYFNRINSERSILFVNESLQDGANECVSAANKYTAHTIVGINNNSKNKDIAKDFIKLLLSEDIQKQANGYGVPINKKAFEDWSDKNTYNGYCGITDSETDFMFMAEEPVAKEVLSKYQPIVEGADTLIDYDSTIYDMIVNQLDDFFEENITAASLVDNVNAKASIYLKE